MKFKFKNSLILLFMVVYLLTIPSVSYGSNVNEVYMINPLDEMRITSDYGYRVHPTLNKVLFHSGLDIGAPNGTPIYSVLDGVVKVSTYSNSFGNFLIISNDNIDIYYAHASKLLVEEGDVVKQGDIIAEVGSTGRSTGPHLHLEIRVNGVNQDPKLFLNTRFNLKEALDEDSFNKIKNNQEQLIKEKDSKKEGSPEEATKTIDEIIIEELSKESDGKLDKLINQTNDLVSKEIKEEESFKKEMIINSEYVIDIEDNDYNENDNIIIRFTFDELNNFNFDK